MLKTGFRNLQLAIRLKQANFENPTHNFDSNTFFTFTGTAFYFLFRGCRMPYELTGNCVTVVTAEGYSNQLSLADFQGF